MERIFINPNGKKVTRDRTIITVAKPKQKRYHPTQAISRTSTTSISVRIKHAREDMRVHILPISYERLSEGSNLLTTILPIITKFIYIG